MITRGERIEDGEHPCKCHEKYVQYESTHVEWIKREYYEIIKWYWCLKCECHWNKVTYAVGQECWTEIIQQPP